MILAPSSIHAQGASCPDGMARVDTFCVDRWEAHLVGQSLYDVPIEGVAT